MKKPDPKQLLGPAGDPARSQWFRSKYPALGAYLFDVTWDDGSARETATLFFFVEAGQLKLCLNDRALRRRAFLTGPSLDELVDALEAGLQSEGLDWRPDRDWTKKR